MPTEKRIVDHVSEVEFLKEIARQEIALLMMSADPIEAVDDPEGFADEILAALLIAIRPELDRLTDEAADYAEALGLSSLVESEIEQVRDETEREFLSVARVSLIAALVPVRAQLQRMLDSGMAAETIRASLRSEATKEALLAGVTSTARGMAGSFMQELSRSITSAAAEQTAMILDAHDEPENFEWLAVLDGNSCDAEIENSCAPRHGVILTMDEWEEMGGPGSPALICSIYAKAGSNCRCELMLSWKVGEARLLNPIDVTEAIANAKERAKLLFAA